MLEFKTIIICSTFASFHAEELTYDISGSLGNIISFVESFTGYIQMTHNTFCLATTTTEFLFRKYSLPRSEILEL